MVLALAAGVMQSPVPAGAGDAPAPPAATVKELMVRDLVGTPGKVLRMVSVEYLAGGASLAHRHHAQVFVYVLDGSVRMQVEGGSLLTLGPGETFYEGPDDVHSVSANASSTRPAHLLVFMVQDQAVAASKAHSATSAAQPQGRP
jgi:quercetin dioxygenase-like cupin family protein